MALLDDEGYDTKSVGGAWVGTGASPSGWDGVAKQSTGFLGGLGSLFGGGGGMMPSMSGSGGASGDSTTKGGNIGGAAFDNSGWNITFGENSAINATRSQGGETAKYVQYALLAGGFLLAWKLLKKM